MKGKVINNEGRNIILKDLKIFEEVKANEKISYPVEQVIQQTCVATGISKKTRKKPNNYCSELLYQVQVRQNHRQNQS